MTLTLLEREKFSIKDIISSVDSQIAKVGAVTESGYINLQEYQKSIPKPEQNTKTYVAQRQSFIFGKVGVISTKRSFKFNIKSRNIPFQKESKSGRSSRLQEVTFDENETVYNKESLTFKSEETEAYLTNEREKNTPKKISKSTLSLSLSLSLS